MVSTVSALRKKTKKKKRQTKKKKKKKKTKREGNFRKERKTKLLQGCVLFFLMSGGFGAPIDYSKFTPKNQGKHDFSLCDRPGNLVARDISAIADG
jgi:hypothetical protein